ncbi:MAG: imidazole glycerol phosphate synthase subunit HisH [Ignavibacteriales bacterium]|nr:Imidazole glycerol phosphate synthase subunit HisH [Ignavibacteriaceae bacterium]MCK6615393.1 imidazole glycerol phosphate synthase subunit HisH [Ignavibacteriaceae bacterium]QOJ28112.1 MAG: imidazole glycerol phosphate synthase subunit HisH [Ignavibacteriales bacterium]
MIAIINYGKDNLEGITAGLSELNQEFCVSSSESEICHADKIIFPGSDELKKVIKNIHLMNLFSMMRMIKKPVLAIDSGMQLLCEYFKAENLTCLGLYPADVYRFEEAGAEVPFKGMHEVEFVKEGVLGRGLRKKEEFVFQNSLFIPEMEETTAISRNGKVFSSVIEKDHFYGVQFHPEQSGEAGLQILRNFTGL